MVGELPELALEKSTKCSRANCDNAAVIYAIARNSDEEKPYCASHAPQGA